MAKLKYRNPDTGEWEEIAGSGTEFTTDDTLSFDGKVLRVNTANEAEGDNTLPITSAAVARSIGNIEALLGTI